MVSYLLRVVDLIEQQTHEQRLCARLFPLGQSLARYHKALRTSLVQPRYGEAVMHLAELDMVVWAFPNDRKIVNLPHLLATAAYSNHDLDTLATTVCGVGSRVASHLYEIVHYVPEHTCTARARLQVESSSCANQPVVRRTITLFGKAYYNAEGAETNRLMRLLWEGNHHARDCQLQIAQPLAYDPQTQILWQMGLPGRTLLTYELGSPAFTNLLGEAACAVALLHRTDLPCLRTTQLQPWVDQLQSVQALLSQVRPQLDYAVNWVVAALLCRAPQARPFWPLRSGCFRVG